MRGKTKREFIFIDQTLDQCAIGIDDCNRTTATCTSLSGGGFKCSCKAGYKGDGIACFTDQQLKQTKCGMVIFLEPSKHYRIYPFTLLKLLK